MKVRVWPVVGFLMGVLWLFVRGVSPSASAVVGQLLVGLAVGFPLAYFFRRLYPERTDVVRGVRVLPYVALYVLVFTREVIVANLDVAYRALSPGMPIEPEVILIPLRVESALGVTTIANSITITPGTVTLDHDAERNALYVHVIDGRDPEEIVEPIRRWEDYALEIFDERLSPDDPAPTVVVDPTRGIVVEDRRRGRRPRERPEGAIRDPGGEER
ncbi:Na+/H+ antiporter subunit E [Haloferacaceae archaeon DSL9]